MLLLLRLCWHSIETGRLRLLLLLLLGELALELLRDGRYRRRRTSLERLLLKSTGLEGLLLRSTGLEGLLLRRPRLERLLLLRSRLAREAGELGLELARSLRLRLLQARVAGVLLLKRRGSLAEACRLGSEGARLLLLLLLLAGLAEGVPVWLGPRTQAVAASEKGIGLGIHIVGIVGTVGTVVVVVVDALRASRASRGRASR